MWSTRRVESHANTNSSGTMQRLSNFTNFFHKRWPFTAHSKRLPPPTSPFSLPAPSLNTIPHFLRPPAVPTAKVHRPHRLFTKRRACRCVGNAPLRRCDFLVSCGRNATGASVWLAYADSFPVNIATTSRSTEPSDDVSGSGEISRTWLGFS